MKDERKASTRTARQFKYEKEREDWTDREIQMAQLYFLTLIQDRTERTRANCSTMIWFIIVIPIVFSIVIFIFSSVLS